MPEARPVSDPPELLPTVVLENARTGQPIVVDLRDYLAQKDGRFANWRLLAHGDFIAPPPVSIDDYPELDATRPVPAQSADDGVRRILARSGPAGSPGADADVQTEAAPAEHGRVKRRWRRGGGRGRER